MPVMLYSVVRCAPIAEITGDRSDRLDTSWVVPATAPPCENPQYPIPHRACVLRRPSPPVGPLPKAKQRFQHRPLFVTDFSVSSHGEPEKRLSLPLSLAFPPKQSTKQPEPFMRPVLESCFETRDGWVLTALSPRIYVLNSVSTRARGEQ